MKIRLVSIPVSDQEAALTFYADTLGFVKKHDIPMGGGNRWLTLVSQYDPEGPELLLEPAPKHFEPSKVYQEALFKAGIPWTQFSVDNVKEEFDRLTQLGVEFKTQPTDIGTAIFAIFNDTCGNYIQLIETK
jgi:catechol 2,3-dioxygenase-like lactoylglutathione lyase family enzyme